MAATEATLAGGLRAGSTRVERRTVVVLALAAITLVAAALRLPFIGHQSLWFDEIYTRSIVREATITGLWRHVEATESTPPLFYLLTWLVKARSAAALRVIPAVALTLAAPAGHFALRRLIGVWPALAAAAMLAVDPMLVEYGTDARSYALFVLIGLLTVWAFSAVLEHGSKKRYALWALACVACLWTHYFGAFLVAGETIVLLVVGVGRRRATFVSAAAIIACAAPLIPLVSAQTDNERAGFIAAMPLSTRFTETVRQFAMGSNVPRTSLEAAGLAVFCLGLLAGVWLAARSDTNTRSLLAIAAIGFVVPLLLSLANIEDRFYSRNMIAILPLAIGLAATGLVRWRAAPLLLYLVLATLTSVWVATNWRYEQSNWKLAIDRVERIERSAPVIAVTELSAAVAGVYLHRAPASTPVHTRRAWLVVEPLRGPKERALNPAPAPTVPGFVVKRSLETEGFELQLLEASVPTEIAPGAVPGATLFGGAR